MHCLFTEDIDPENEDEEDEEGTTPRHSKLELLGSCVCEFKVAYNGTSVTDAHIASPSSSHVT